MQHSRTTAAIFLLLCRLILGIAAASVKPWTVLWRIHPLRQMQAWLHDSMHSPGSRIDRAFAVSGFLHVHRFSVIAPMPEMLQQIPPPPAIAPGDSRTPPSASVKPDLHSGHGGPCCLRALRIRNGEGKELADRGIAAAKPQ